MRRRALLAAAAGGFTLAGFHPPAAGSREVRQATASDADDATSPAATDDGPPVVDNAGDPDETVTVDVLVVDEGGDPAGGVTVKLEDRGGTPDDRFGETGPAGRLRFLESVGPPPCNTQTVKLPDHGLAADLGCNDGGAELDHTFTLVPGRTPATPSDVAATTPATTNGTAPPTPTTTDEAASTAPAPAATSETAPPGSWLAGWELLASWFVAIALAGPLALGALVALVEQFRPAEDTGDD